MGRGRATATHQMLARGGRHFSMLNPQLIRLNVFLGMVRSGSHFSQPAAPCPPPPPVPYRTNLIPNRDAEAPRKRKVFPLHQEFGDAHFSVVGGKDGLGREGCRISNAGA